MEKMVNNSRENIELINNANLIINSLGVLNSKFSGKTVLITGAAGFLGCQFVYYFDLLNSLKINEKPTKVYLWDNFICRIIFSFSFYRSVWGCPRLSSVYRSIFRWMFFRLPFLGSRIWYNRLHPLYL